MAIIQSSHQPVHTELAPTGTLQTFFELQSFGKFKVKGDVQDWIVAPYPEEYYSYDNFGLTAHFAKCAYGALDIGLNMTRMEMEYWIV